MSIKFKKPVIKRKRYGNFGVTINYFTGEVTVQGNCISVNSPSLTITKNRS